MLLSPCYIAGTVCSGLYSLLCAAKTLHLARAPSDLTDSSIHLHSPDPCMHAVSKTHIISFYYSRCFFQSCGGFEQAVDLNVLILFMFVHVQRDQDKLCSLLNC